MLIYYNSIPFHNCREARWMRDYIGKTVRDSKSFHQTVWGKYFGKIYQGIKFGCIGVNRLLGQPFQQMLFEYNDPFLDPYIRNLSLVQQLVCACMRQTIAWDSSRIVTMSGRAWMVSKFEKLYKITPLSFLKYRGQSVNRISPLIK